MQFIKEHAECRELLEYKYNKYCVCVIYLGYDRYSSIFVMYVINDNFILLRLDLEST